MAGLWHPFYGPATTYVPPHATMDIRVNRRLRLHTHDNIHHVRVFWGTLPLLLFSDPRMVHPVDVNQFQGQAVPGQPGQRCLPK